MHLNFTVYLIPPILSLVIGLSLAGLALTHGKLRRENVLFALVCFWWSLLSPIFIGHHILENEQQILKLERAIHFFYVYLPVINLMFFYKVLNLRRPMVIGCSFALSFILSLTTTTDLYISGLHRYEWGYMARGEIAFQVFGLYGFLVLIHSVSCFLSNLRTESNPVVRRKNAYMMISFLMVGVLTMLNIPAIIGIDLYPAGNFSFVALGVLAYGVLKYQLMDIRSALYMSLFWLLVSSLVLIPNALIFIFVRGVLPTLHPALGFGLILIWFAVNFVYVVRVQPIINQSFNKVQLGLRRTKDRFIAEIALLKNLSESIQAITRTLIHTLGFPHVTIYLRDGKRFTSRSTPSISMSLKRDLHVWLAQATGIFDRHMVETDPQYESIKVPLLELFSACKSTYVLPLSHAKQLEALILLPERPHVRHLSQAEIEFLSGIRNAAAVALANSTMFQHIANLKDQLEGQTRDLKVQIEERNVAEQARLKTEEKYRLLAENVRDIIWILDIKTRRFTYVSPSVHRVLGFTVEEAIMQPLTQVIVPQSQQTLEAHLKEPLEKARAGNPTPGWATTLELELNTAQGSTVWTEVTLSFLVRSTNSVPELMGIARDITERRRRQLLQLEKAQAEKANQAKSRFLANMSHELRTPLNHIIGFTELVVDQKFGPLNASQMEYLDDVLTSSNHLLELINDILDLSKVEAGKMALDVEEVNVAALIEQSLPMVKEKAIRNGIQIMVDVMDKALMLRADERKLKQVMYNLLANAIKFTPSNGQITVEAQNVVARNGSVVNDRGQSIELPVSPLVKLDPRRAYVSISVRDTGIGIDSADLERIFNPFDQVENSASRKFEGTGLGLSLSRKFVSMHEGHVWALSDGPGKGSRFIILIPLPASHV